jgi:hypothetical protein
MQCIYKNEDKLDDTDCLKVSTVNLNTENGCEII